MSNVHDGGREDGWDGEERELQSHWVRDQRESACGFRFYLRVFFGKEGGGVCSFPSGLKEANKGSKDVGRKGAPGITEPSLPRTFEDMVTNKVESKHVFPTMFQACSSCEGLNMSEA